MINQTSTMVLTGREEEIPVTQPSSVEYVRTRQDKVINRLSNLESGEIVETKISDRPSSVFKQMVECKMTTQQLSLESEGTKEEKMAFRPPEIEAQEQEMGILPPTFMCQGTGEEATIYPSSAESSVMVAENVITQSSHTKNEETGNNRVVTQSIHTKYEGPEKDKIVIHSHIGEPAGTENKSVHSHTEEPVGTENKSIHSHIEEAAGTESKSVYSHTEEPAGTENKIVHSHIEEPGGIENKSFHSHIEEPAGTENKSVHSRIEEPGGIENKCVHSRFEEPGETDNKSIFKCSTTTESEWRQSGVSCPAPVAYKGHPETVSSDNTSPSETRHFTPSGTALLMPSLPCSLPDTNGITTRHRRTSMKSGRTPPGTPVEEKKFVRFADALGLELAKVKTFCNEAVPNIPKSAFDDLENVPFSFDKLVQTQVTNLTPIFIQPVGLPDFLQRVRKEKVCLENAMALDDHTITGTVRVFNIDYIKSVYVRYTCDEWRTFAEVRANYVPNSHDGFSDKFSFVFYPSLNPGERTMFAVRYHCAGQLFWDNNFKQNYIFKCFKKRPNRSSVVYTSSPFVT